MKIARDEIFGPVLSVIGFDDLEGAIRIANNTIYGLGACVWTRDLRTAHEMSRRLDSGTVWVNCYDASDDTVPFGGFKQSGIGADRSMHALKKFFAAQDILDEGYALIGAKRAFGTCAIGSELCSCAPRSRN